ncbi:adenylate kinase [candidate division KSB1 bacterium]|nr:adenylate kinase [candidate division KSB1 bacterium]
MKLIFLGAPGTGKGTQGKILAEQKKWPHISTGDILRNAVKNGTELGVKAKAFMDAGKLVPDELMNDLVAERLSQSDCQAGFILDGFPRTINQAKTLDDYLKRNGLTLDGVILLDVDPKVLVARLTSRRLCRGCGKDYNVITNPPPANGKCIACGGEIYQRDDDNEVTVTRRLQVYQEQTNPLVEYYQNTGKLVVIDGNQDVQKVQQQIEQLI